MLFQNRLLTYSLKQTILELEVIPWLFTISPEKRSHWLYRWLLTIANAVGGGNKPVDPPLSLASDRLRFDQKRFTTI